MRTPTWKSDIGDITTAIRKYCNYHLPSGAENATVLNVKKIRGSEPCWIADVEYSYGYQNGEKMTTIQQEEFPCDSEIFMYSSRRNNVIKSSPNFKEFTADDIFDSFNTEELTDTVFMDREQCKANKCGMDEFHTCMYDVLPTHLGVYTADDVREVCRRAKNPKAKAFLEAFETALENAKFVDKFYDSIKIHKKGEIASSSWKELMDDSDWDYGNPESYEVWDDDFGVSFKTTDKQEAEEFYNTHPESLYLIEYLEHGNRIIKSKENNMIKSSTIPRTTKELADWMIEYTNWSVDYDEEKDVFFSGPEDEAHYIENGKVITDGDGWTEDYTVEEFMNIMNEGKINSSIIKSSQEDAFTVHPWDKNQVTGTSDEDLGLSYVVEAYGNEFVNVDDETLNDIRDKVLLRYFDDDAYVRDWNINYSNDQIESAYDIIDPEDLNNEELARYFDYEAYGRDLRLNHNMVWDSEEECWVSAHDVDDSELDNDKYIFMRG